MLVQSIHFAFAPEDAGKAESILRVGRSEEKPHVFALWEVYRDLPRNA